MLVLIVLHFILHLPWISATSRKMARMPWPAAFLAVTLLAVLTMGGMGWTMQANNARYEHDAHAPQVRQHDDAHEPGQGLRGGSGRGPRDGNGRGTGRQGRQ